MRTIERRENPIRRENPLNVLEKYLKRNIKDASVRRDGRNVMLKRNGKHYRVALDDDMYFIFFFDPELGTAPKIAQDIETVKAIILSDEIQGEPAGYEP